MGPCPLPGSRGGGSVAAGRSTAESLERLARFVLRARLVQEHSLAEDKLALERYAEWKVALTVTEDRQTGERTVEMKRTPLLPTEQVESAAARVRPLFLKRDGVHYTEVIAALQDAVALAGPDILVETEVLLAEFQAADPDYPAGRPKGPRTERSISNKQLAGAWLYGHLLHEDEVRRTYGYGISPEEMLLNATKTVCAEVLATVKLLHLTERLVVDGTLELPEELFTDPVIVTAREWAPKIASAYVADVGTPMPASLDEPLGDEWKQVHDVFGRTTQKDESV